MVDDSIEIPDRNFTRPNDSPRNVHYYNLPVLAEDQQKKLYALKRQIHVEDEKYLANHPEVRACIALGLRNILRLRPKYNVLEIFARYYAKSKVDLEEEIANYLKEKKIIGHEDASSVNQSKKVKAEIASKSKAKRTFKESGSTVEYAQDILNGVIEKAIMDSRDLSQDEIAGMIMDIVDDFRVRAFSRARLPSFQATSSDQRIATTVKEMLSGILSTVTSMVDGSQ